MNMYNENINTKKPVKNLKLRRCRKSVQLINLNSYFIYYYHFFFHVR